MRIACVQNGDFTLARRVLSAGGDETYKGQRYTVNGFLRFVKGLPHVVISLDAPPHHEASEEGEYLAVSAPAQRFWIPRRFTERARAAGIIKELARFKPTHLLLCCNDVVGCEILQWAIAHGVQSAVITASHFRRDHPPCVRFCKLASDPSVAFVANHNRAATASLLECGLRQDKAVMWDLPQFDLVPERFEPKTLDPAAPLRVMLACALIPEKGVTDAVDGCDLLRQRGRDVRMVICGKGPLRQRLLDHHGTKEGWLEVVGQVSHDEVLRRMLASHLVIVPSRHSFPEAMPFVIQEALAMRTPLIVSDHPIFSQYFSDGDAMRMFAASDPAALAVTIEDLIARPQRYRELSERTAAVWASFQIDTKYHHLLETLDEKWDVALAKARAAGPTAVLEPPTDLPVSFRPPILRQQARAEQAGG